MIVEHLGELRRILEQNDLHLKPETEKFEEIHPPLATVGALIFNGSGEVLMIRTHKWSNLWGIPGGKIKWGEPSVDALRREIKEETGLDVTDIEFVLVQDCIHSREFYRDAHFVLLNYTCRCAGKPRVTLNDEARESRWVTTAGALKMPLNTPTRILLEAVLKTKPATDHADGADKKSKQICVIRGSKMKNSLPKITIVDLEVFYRVGVPAAERVKPQRLLLTVEMDFDFSAAGSDDLRDTIDYFAISQRLLKFGDGREWKLIEKLAADIADMILTEFKPQSVTVEVKKFPVPEARHVSVILRKP